MKGFRGLSPKRAISVQLALVIAITFAVYSNILFNGFVIDDSFQVTGNRWIRDIRYLPEIFSSNFVLGGKTAFYRPLLHVFYMIGYHLLGLAPWGFHLMSIVFHAGVSVLVFLTISRLLGERRPPDVPSVSAEADGEGPQWAPLAGALLFATHPIHTEAVAWISVTDLYMTFFYLLSFYLYVRSSEGGPSWGAAYAFPALSFFLAALCKEPALTLPAVLVVYDYVFRKEGRGISYYAKRYVPFVIACGVYFALRIRALGGMVTFKTPLKLSPYEYLVDVLALFAKYIEKLLLPVRLNVWHVFEPPATLFSLSGIGALLMTAAFLIAAVVAIRKNRVALLGFMIILLPLLPALYLPGLTQGLENAFTERYLYLPSFGFILLVALLVSRIEKEAGARRALAMGLVLTVIIFSYGSIIRNTAWKDNYTIWSDSVRKSPGSAVAHNGLGDALREKGRPDEAIQQYLAALRFDPGNSFSHASLGLAYADKGRPDRAIGELQMALRLNPGYADAHDFLGVVYGSVGQHEKAIAEFQAALSLNPQLDYTYRHLGIAYNNLKMTDKAIEYFKTALNLNPDDADASNNLGIIFAERGMMQEAVEQFETAVRLKPADASFRYNAARAYQVLGRTDLANEQMRKAKGLEGDNR